MSMEKDKVGDPEEDPVEDPEEDPLDDVDDDPSKDPEEDPVEDLMETPREDPVEDGYIFPTPLTVEEEHVDDGVIWRDVHIYILSPFPSDDDHYEDLIFDALEADPATRPPPQLPMIPLVLHDWIVGRLSADLTIAEAMTDQLRSQLATEGEARRIIQGGRRDSTPRMMRRAMDEIELRARSLMR